MILETNRLILRHYQDSDKSELSKICSDNEVMKFVFNGVVVKEQFDEFIKKYFAVANTSIGLGTMCIKATDEIIGFAGLHHFEEFEKSGIEFGFVIAKDFWGNGYATEIGNAQIEFGRKLGYPSMFATVHPENVESIRLLKKLGLTEIKRTRIDRGERIIFTTMN